MGSIGSIGPNRVQLFFSTRVGDKVVCWGATRIKGPPEFVLSHPGLVPAMAELENYTNTTHTQTLLCIRNIGRVHRDIIDRGDKP